MLFRSFNDRTSTRKVNRCSGRDDRCVPDQGSSSPSWSYNSGTDVYTLTSDTSSTYYFTNSSGIWTLTGDGSGTFTFTPSGVGDAGTFTEVDGVGRVFVLTYVAGGPFAPSIYTWVSYCDDECSPGGSIPETCTPDSGVFRKNSSTGFDVYSFYSGGILVLILTQTTIGGVTFSSSDEIGRAHV